MHFHGVLSHVFSSAPHLHFDIKQNFYKNFIDKKIFGQKMPIVHFIHRGTWGGEKQRCICQNASVYAAAIHTYIRPRELTDLYAFLFFRDVFCASRF